MGWFEAIFGNVGNFRWYSSTHLHVIPWTRVWYVASGAGGYHLRDGGLRGTWNVCLWRISLPPAWRAVLSPMTLPVPCWDKRCPRWQLNWACISLFLLCRIVKNRFQFARSFCAPSNQSWFSEEVCNQIRNAENATTSKLCCCLIV